VRSNGAESHGGGADIPTVSGRVAIVTGASRGIGRATALRLARRGANVVTTARSAAPLDELAAAIAGAGGSCLPVPGDASDEHDVQRTIDEAIRAFKRIDILVNNAGIGILGPLKDASVADFDQTMAANVRSVFLFSRAVITRMIAQGGGAIVNVASLAGIAAFPNTSLYNASKFAAVGMTRAMDRELREHNIKVTAICPAGVETDWAMGTGLTREQVAGLDRLSPDTVAEAILFALTQPANARVAELIVYPMSEDGHQ
jgi:NAD(P)-dependent dehydrogenase (short-subunit alcohol dehydrogenase family)